MRDTCARTDTLHAQTRTCLQRPQDFKRFQVVQAGAVVPDSNEGTDSSDSGTQDGTTRSKGRASPIPGLPRDLGQFMLPNVGLAPLQASGEVLWSAPPPSGVSDAERSRAQAGEDAETEVEALHGDKLGLMSYAESSEEDGE